MLSSLRQDLRHGGRVLAHARAFSLIVIVSLAIGVGANAAMFSIADGLIMRPLAVADGGELVRVAGTTPSGELGYRAISHPDYLDLRREARSFDGLIAARGLVATLGRERGQSPAGRYGLAVSDNFFDVLGVAPVHGRAFVPGENGNGGGEPAVLLSHDAWVRLFAADPEAVGQQVRLAGQAFTVIGIAPQAFTGLDIYLPTAFYVPLGMLPLVDVSAGPEALTDRAARTLRVVGRLREGVTPARADEDVRLIAAALAEAHEATNRAHGLRVRTETEARFDEFGPVMSLSVMLLGLAVAVLFVACANVAGLLAGRAPARAREMAMRLALGSSRARLVRQLSAEMALLAAAGGALGLACGYALIRSFQQFQLASDLGVRLTFALDARALLAAVVAAAASVVLSTAAYAWRVTRDSGVPAATRAIVGAGHSRSWGRHGLVTLQIALTLVLLTVATSFYRAFQAEYGRGPGFRTEGLLLATIDPALARYDAQRTAAFHEAVETELAALPGVTAVATTSFVPLGQDGAEVTTIVPELYAGRDRVDGFSVMSARVNEEFFDTMRIPIVAGRGFVHTDADGAELVAVVTRGTAARYWPGEDAVGKRLRLTGSDQWVTVVGVAADAKVRLFTPVTTPFLYFPRRQHLARRTTVIIETTGDARAAAPGVRAAIAALDPDVPILALRTMEDFYHANSRNLNTIVVRTIAAMGMTSLFLALVGLYGLVAYLVSRRTREIGIRVAVGALPRRVVHMFLRQGIALGLGGLAVGVVASLGAGRVIRAAFPGTGGDVLTYAAVTLLVFGTVALAAYIPARRASQMSPLAALRQD